MLSLSCCAYGADVLWRVRLLPITITRANENERMDGYPGGNATDFLKDIASHRPIR
jgi:hypothetical protein